MLSITLENCTVAANTVAPGNPGPGGTGGSGSNDPGMTGGSGRPDRRAGGHLARGPTSNPALLTSISSIVAGDFGAGKFVDVDGTFAVATNSLLGSELGAIGFINGLDGNLVGLNPQLGPLQDNGGPTPTMALLSGSPAINAGSNPLGLVSRSARFRHPRRRGHCRHGRLRTAP